MYKSASLRERLESTPLWPGNYRLGMWIWLAQRVSGLGLVLYLFLHLFVISSSMAGKGGTSFNESMKFLESPFFIWMEIILLAAILLHMFNGIRILLFDWGIGVRHQKLMFWGVIVIAAVLWLIGTVLLLPFALGQKTMF